MQISIIKQSETKSVGRLDAEFFHPKYINEKKLIETQKWAFLETLSSVKGGKRLPLNANFSEQGVSYIRAEDIKNDFTDYETSPFISVELHEKLINYQTKYNDILVTIVGNSIGDVAITKFNLDKCNLTENCAKIPYSKKINPHYLLMFLKSKYGQSQIHREKVGTAQPKLAIIRIRQFKIPLFSEKFQKNIEDMVLKAHAQRESANTLTKEAQTLLEKELGIYEWTPPKQKLNISIKKHSDTTHTNRIDAEYYQEKYDAILHKITSYKGGYKILGENMRSVLYKIKSEQIYNYIELATIDSQGFITDTEPTLGKDLPSRARRIVNIGDILISSVEGSLNKSALVDIKSDQFVCSTGFYILSACNQLNSETLFMYFRLPFIRELLAKMCKGTILTAFDKSSLENFVIPILDKKIQDEIAIKITNAYQSRQLAKQLLELAKSTVENAIEHGE